MNKMTYLNALEKDQVIHHPDLKESLRSIREATGFDWQVVSYEVDVGMLPRRRPLIQYKLFVKCDVDSSLNYLQLPFTFPDSEFADAYASQPASAVVAFIQGMLWGIKSSLDILRNELNHA